MNVYNADFSFYDESYIIRRHKNKEIKARSVIEAALIIKQSFNVIRIRSIKEKEELQECILNEYPYQPEINLFTKK